MGKIRGTPYMRSHIFVHRATTKYFSNSFVFRTKIEKEGLPKDSPAGLGAGGPEFKSRRPRPKHLACFLYLIESSHSIPACGIPLDRRSRFASRLVSKSSPHDEHAKNTGRQERYSEAIERRQVKRALAGKYGGNHGDPVHFSSHRSSEMQIGGHALGSAHASQCLSIWVLNRPR
jgi:hypothetical protein